MQTIEKEISQPGRAISTSRTGEIFTDGRSITALKRIVQTAFLACIGVVLVACGGGDDNTPPPGGGATGAAVSQGVFTAPGSVVVNGIKYTTTGATIRIDDNPGVESDLKLGMVVKVRGTSDDATKTGTATQIEARDRLEGTISNVDAAAKTITVMGQTVRIEDNVTRLNDDDAQKVFGDANFVAGNIVEVHGFADDQGGVRATRVFRKPAGTGEFESKGFVTALGVDSFGLSLTPGGTAVFTVNFAPPVALPAGTADRSFVEVKSTGAPVAGAVTATLIKLEDKLGATGEKVEVEGIVSSGTVASFVVNGQQVVTSASTVFEGGPSSDFAVGVKLEAEGPLNANGAIDAAKISFRSNVKIEADVTAVSATSLTVLGRTVAINQFTRTDNGPPVVSGHVEVRAISGRDGNLIATRIVVQGPSARAFLQGPVTAANSTLGTLTFLGTTTIAGITVASDAGTAGTEWRLSSNETEVATTKAAFFAQIVANVTVVKVRWDPFSSVVAPIDEAEIETTATTAPPATTTTTTGATTSTTATGATTSTTATGATTSTTAGGGTTSTATTATSTSTTATTVTSTTSTTLALNGATLYANNCSGCHNPLATSEKQGTSVSATNAAIGANRGGMGSLSTLTQAQITAIVAALQ